MSLNWYNFYEIEQFNIGLPVILSFTLVIPLQLHKLEKNERVKTGYAL